MVDKWILAGICPLLLLTTCDNEKSSAALRPGGGLETRVVEIAPDSFLIRRETYLDSLLDSRIVVLYADSTTAQFYLYQANELRLAPVDSAVLASRAAFKGLFGYVATECLEDMAATRSAYLDEAAYQHALKTTLPRIRQTAYLSAKSRTGFGASCLEEDGRSRSSRSSGG